MTARMPAPTSSIADPSRIRSRLRAAMKTNSTPPGTSASPRASALKAKASAITITITIASPASVAQPTS